ncbi:MAG TPA: Mu transposase C-terminal domain-containing protein [Candidatus Limnocylindrales bacterium]|nr:Mu transposase C-terminal domain-containing protein [Candidatus Limnocylindrales bacterium]
MGRLRRRVQQILAEQPGIDLLAVMPARTTFYRLAQQMSAGKHTFGSARTRRSTAAPPDGPFGTVRSQRPGEWMQIDSTPLDVRVVLDNGIIDAVELTWLIDLATKTIPAAVLSPTTKAVDAALLLARSLTPEPMRPGWADALRMARSVLPHRRLVDIDARLEHAAARPVIVPETIVCDRGMVYMSQAFRNACRAMGISLQPCHPGSAWQKGTVETSFSAVSTLFAQYVAGYVGNSVERRGRHAEQAATWSMIELQGLLDEWLVTTWQTRPHDGLRHPITPGKALTPNEMYAALVETAGYVAVPLSESDYIELLPATWRAINAYGVKIGHRTYDSKALNGLRRQHSGVHARKGLWEIHFDPYDVSRVWVRNHHDGGWIQAPWTLLKTAPMPFGQQAWDHARQMLERRGQDPVTEAEIAQAAQALLDKAEHAPSGKEATKGRRVAGRTRATTARAQQTPLPSPHTPDTPHDTVSDDEDDGPLAEVIPLGIFDAHEEAKKWW